MLDMWLIVLLFSPGPWATRSHWHLEDAWEPLDFLISFLALEVSFSPATSYPVRGLLPSPAGASHQISPDSPLLLEGQVAWWPLVAGLLGAAFIQD